MFYPNIVLKGTMLDDQSGNQVPLLTVGVPVNTVVLDTFERGLPVNFKYLESYLQIVNPEDMASNNRKFTIECIVQPQAISAIYATPSYPAVNTFVIYARPDGVHITWGVGDYAVTAGWIPYTKDERGKFNHLTIHVDGSNSAVTINGTRRVPFSVQPNHLLGGSFLGHTYGTAGRILYKYQGNIALLALYGGSIIPVEELEYFNSKEKTSRGLAMSVLPVDQFDLANIDGYVLQSVGVEGAILSFEFTNGSALRIVRPTSAVPGVTVTKVEVTQIGRILVTYSNSQVEDIGEIPVVEAIDSGWVPGTGYLVSVNDSLKYVPIETTSTLAITESSSSINVALAITTASPISFNNKVRLERVLNGNVAFMPNLTPSVWNNLEFNRVLCDSIPPTFSSTSAISLLPGKYHITGNIPSLYGGISKARLYDPVNDVVYAESDVSYQTDKAIPAISNFNDAFVVNYVTTAVVQLICTTGNSALVPATTLGLVQHTPCVISIYKG